MSELAPSSIDRPEPTDVDRIVSLWKALVRSQGPFGTSLLAEGNDRAVRDRLSYLLAIDGVRVARCQESIVGFVTFELWQDTFEYETSAGVVQNLFVDPDHRCRGIGSALLAAAESELTNRGAVRIRLEVLIANERARSFYTRHGYNPQRLTLQKDGETDTSNGD